MTDKIIKQNVIVYDSNDVPVDITKYVSSWTIANGGIKAGNTGLDGIVVMGNMVVNNDIDVNFNPEAEFGVLKTIIKPFVGDGGASYAGVPTDVWTKAVGFNKIYNGTAYDWDDLTTWDAWTNWNNTTGSTDNSGLYGNIKVSGSNFITPFIMPVGTLFEIIYTYIDYTERNPINTVDDAWSPLLDENARIEIYALEEEPSWMEYIWKTDGTNSFANPTGGTPLVRGIGIFKARTGGTWDELTTWDAWTEWEQNDVAYDFTTEAYYDEGLDKIVLGATPDSGKILIFSISYYVGTPEMIFSGYLGDSINPNPIDKTIELSFRDKGKLLQDTMIDNLTNVVDVSNWNINKTLAEDVVSISQVDSTTGIFTATAHGFLDDDEIQLYQIDDLPLQTNGERLTGTYTVDNATTNTFTLAEATLEAFTTTLNINVKGLKDRGSGYSSLSKRYVKFNVNTTATLDFTSNTLVFDLPFEDPFYQDVQIWYLDKKALVYTKRKEGQIGTANVNFTQGSGFHLLQHSRSEVVVTDEKTVTLTFKTNYVNFQDIKETEARARLVKDYAELPTAVSTITPATDKITTTEDHLFQDGDIVSLTSDDVLPTGKTSPTADTLDLDDFYEIGVEDATNVKLYTRSPATGELVLVDIITAGSGNITLVSTQFEVFNAISNIIRDLNVNNNGTLPTVNIVEDIEDGYLRKIGLNTDIWNGKTVWDTLQDIASQKALYIAYIWNETASDFVLTVKNLEAKTTADFTLASNEIYLQTQEITGADIRNSVFVNYYDSKDGANRKSVSTTDATSSLRYGSRPSVITEGRTSAINNEDIAQALANAILEASKDRVIESVATIPFQFEWGTDFERIEPGVTVGLTYKYLDNTGGLVPFYAIESIEHSFNQGTYQTRLRGNKQKVRTSVKRYKRMESRPGAFRQQTGRDLSELYQIPAPSGLAVQSSGLEAVNLAPRAYAIIEWERPENYYPQYYILQVRRSDGTYAEGNQYQIDNTETKLVSERIILEPSIEYKCQVVAWSRSNVKGVVANEVTISSIGDSTAPDTVTGLSVVGLDEGLQVSFTASTAGDLLGYRIYIRKGATPTTSTYDYRKITNSTTTVFSGLGLEPGSYQVGVTAFDTSGNESTISSIITADISPKLVIRTQAQFDTWMTEINVSTPHTPEYDEVIIYNKGSAYEWGTSGTPSSDEIDISKNDFTIIGIGNPVIERYAASNGLYFRITTNNGGIYGINYNLKGSYQGEIRINDKDSSAGIIGVKECNFDCTSTYSNNRALFVVIQNGAILNITNNKAIGHDSFVYTSTSNNFDDGKTLISNNIFEPESEGYFSYMTFADSADVDLVVKNVSIIDNKFKNSSILFAVSSNTTNKCVCENVTVTNNYCEVDSALSSSYKRFVFITKAYNGQTEYRNINISNNQYYFNQTSGSGYHFLNVGFATIDFIYSMFTNNSAYGNVASWITMTSFSGASTGTIIANNTNN